MQHLPMQTKDITDENIAKLKALFPNAVTEIKGEDGNVREAIDFDVLRQELSHEIVEGREERYQFTWPDKKKAMLEANTPINKTLRPVVEDSVGKDGTPGGFDSENLYIEGDNLDVLKLLRETYLGKIKMIYIDPPYNTGNDFIYDDDFSMDRDEFSEVSGQVSEEGFRMVQNTESNGRFHTDWLNMMYPRLKLAKDLLSEDGVIFMSIDDNEVDNLKKLCDEVLGRWNLVAELIWSAGRKNDSKHISISHEYILCYFKNMQYITEHQIIWREKKQGLDAIYSIYESLRKRYGNNIKTIEKDLKNWYKALPDGHPAKDHNHYNHVDEKGVYFSADISWPGGGGPKYTILHPITGKPVKIPSRGWLTNELTMKTWIAEGKVQFGDDENGVPTLKSYLKDHEYTVPYSVFYKDGRAASKRLATLMGEKVFENPKDEEIIKRIIEFSGTSKNDIILDFFSGSGTTAHSLFLAEAENCLHRKFILVQIPENIVSDKISSEKSKRVALNAIELLDSLGLSHNICEIGKERIRRAGRKIKQDSPLTTQDLDVGFRCLRIDSSNMKDIYYRPKDYTKDLLDVMEGNIKPDRSPMDLLFQVMLDLGISLSSPIEETTIQGKHVFNVDNNILIACFDDNIDESVITEIAKQKPYYFVMRDSGMASDSVAANFEQIFETYSRDTVRRVL